MAAAMSKRGRRPLAIVALSLLVTVALAGCEGEPLPGDDNGTPTVDPALARLYWPFEEATFVQGDEISMFVQWPVPADSGTDLVRPERTSLSWFGSRSGFYTDFADQDGMSLGNLTISTVAADAGPTFGTAGHNATNVTIMVFAEDGRLIAHTESPPLPLSELGRVPWTANDNFGTFQLPISIDYETYYLGDAEEAPDGTVKPPSAFEPYLRTIREVALGLPVGGVAAAIVPAEDWQFGSVYGDLYVTARIDTLVHAP